MTDTPTDSLNDNQNTGDTTALIVRQERLYLTARTDKGNEYLCSVPRRHLQCVENKKDLYPVIGDRVVLNVQNNEQAVIQEILPRQNVLQRKKSGKTNEIQNLAANVDYALIVSALDGGRNFNIRRLERFLSIASTNRIRCILVLNKTDLCEDPAPYASELYAAFPQLPIQLTSAETGEGIKKLCNAIPADSTTILLGPSGVGKSALINALAGQTIQLEAPSRDTDKRGRHTTTNRQLFYLTDNRRIIDTPGIREIQTCNELQETDAFNDIEALAQQCRFRDCTHAHEPGCAVQAAVAAGEIDPARYTHYIELQSQHKQLKSDLKHSRKIAEKRNWKKRKYRD